jgi:hypothetical protein
VSNNNTEAKIGPEKRTKQWALDKGLLSWGGVEWEMGK